MGEAAADAEVVSATCRQWPYQPEIELAAAAFEVTPFDPVMGGRGIEVAVAMLKGSASLASTHYDASEDASVRWRQDSLRFDTARYDLGGEMRAVALITSAGYSPPCADGGTPSEFTLMQPQAGQLRPVLTIPWSRWVQHGECSCQCSEGQEPRIDEARFTLAVADEQHLGFRDIVLAAEVTSGSGNWQLRRRLQFDGERYGTQDWDREFDSRFYRHFIAEGSR